MAAPVINHTVTGQSTLAVTIETGEALVVIIGTHQGDVTNVKFNTTETMTEVLAVNTAYNETVHFFYLASPSVTTANVTFSASGTGDGACALVISGQKTSGQPISFAGNGDDNWITGVSGYDKLLWVGGIYSEAPLTMDTGLGLTEQYNGNYSSYENFGVATKASDAGIEHIRWTQSFGARSAIGWITIQGSDSTTIASGTVNQNITNTDDDMEEDVSSTVVSDGSSDLELARDTGANQIVGMLFRAVPISPGATITTAYVTFTVKAVAGTTVATVNVYGEDADNSADLVASNANLSSRTSTTANSDWVLDSVTNTINETFNTPSLVSVIQEIVDRAGWAFGNNLTILVKQVSGTGWREPDSRNNSATECPKLYVVWEVVAAGVTTRRYSLTTLGVG